MKKNASIAGTSDWPRGRPPDGARTRRLALLAVLCVIARADEYALAPTHFGPMEGATALHPVGAIGFYCTPDTVDVGPTVAGSGPVTANETADAPADEGAAGHMMAAVYPPMLVAAPPSPACEQTSRI
jgi:hypothetical protein